MKCQQIILFVLFYFYVNADSNTRYEGMLQVQESESRQVYDLSGMWNFRADLSPCRCSGQKEKWFQKPLSQSGPVLDMPVPSSYNDITTDEALRDFVGWVWYDREVYIPSDWVNKRIILRVDSAHYYSSLYVNGKLIVEHNGGHLPFEGDVSSYINYSKANLITIAVNNTLSAFTIPPGTLTFHGPSQYPKNYMHQNLQFDFFNYAGIHRRVRLYTTPKTFISDINITTTYQGSTGYAMYNILAGGLAPKSVIVNVLMHNGSVVGTASSLSSNITIPEVKLWWPYTMNDKQYGYQYTLELKLSSRSGLIDVYRQKFGVRSVEVSGSKIFINKKSFYCQGVAKHEDSDIRGKGLDFALIARDFHMLKWLGVNCFRTSHYPYAEEIMDQADKQGIVVIDECPAVGLKTDLNFSEKTKAHHLETIRELIRRDKNRPSVIMWSIANEPYANNHKSAQYLTDVIEFTKTISHGRLVTYVASGSSQANKACQHVDIICVNKYFGWYEGLGETYLIPLQLPAFLDGYHSLYGHPVIITEYGAETIPGMHNMPELSFTEDYQSTVLRLSHHVFDDLKESYLVGEMVWNFADFMTKQQTTRIMGNHKGLLTRQRQPKMGAHVIRSRYWSMINQTMATHYNSTLDHWDNQQHGLVYYMYGLMNQQIKPYRKIQEWTGNLLFKP